MSKRQFIILVILTIISSFFGGVTFNYLASPAGSAQSNIPKVIKAQEFRLVDKNGSLLASLGVTKDSILPPDTALRIYDDLGMLSSKYGNVATEYYLTNNKVKSMFGLLGAEFWDDNGKLRINLDAENNHLELLDENQKVRAGLGRESLKYTETGGEEIRPESSLVFFKDDGKVLWEAP